MRFLSLFAISGAAVILWLSIIFPIFAVYTRQEVVEIYQLLL